MPHRHEPVSRAVRRRSPRRDALAIQGDRTPPVLLFVFPLGEQITDRASRFRTLIDQSVNGVLVAFESIRGRQLLPGIGQLRHCEKFPLPVDRGEITRHRRCEHRLGPRQRLVGQQRVIRRYGGDDAGVIVDRRPPLPQGDVRIGPAGIKPLEVSGHSIGFLLGKRFDGGRVIGHLGLGVGPLAGELSTQLEHPGVSWLFREPFING